MPCCLKIALPLPPLLLLLAHRGMGSPGGASTSQKPPLHPPCPLFCALQGRWADCLNLIQDSATQVPELASGIPVDLQVKAGTSAARLGRFEEARDFLSCLDSCDVDDYADLFYSAADCWQELLRHGDALRLLRRLEVSAGLCCLLPCCPGEVLASRHPPSAPAPSSLHPASEQPASRPRQASPSHRSPGLLLQIGDCCSKLGRFDEAVEARAPWAAAAAALGCLARRVRGCLRHHRLLHSFPLQALREARDMLAEGSREHTSCTLGMAQALALAGRHQESRAAYLAAKTGGHGLQQHQHPKEEDEGGAAAVVDAEELLQRCEVLQSLGMEDEALSLAYPALFRRGASLPADLELSRAISGLSRRFCPPCHAPPTCRHRWIANCTVVVPALVAGQGLLLG